MAEPPSANEQITGNTTAQATVEGAGLRRKDGKLVSFNKNLTYSKVDGRAMFEGDICLGTPEKPIRSGGEGHPEGVVISGELYRWPLGIMPYAIEQGFANPQRIVRALEHWEQKTEVQFVERTAANKDRYPDYVYFVDRGACWSMVGRQGGRQELSVGPACQVGNVIHEIGHALGLWHEQSREDRLKYVKIHAENVHPQALHNFNQHVIDGDDLGEYDYVSIMHYPKNAFSRNGQITIEPLQPGVAIGQRQGLSNGDCKAIALVYSQQFTKRGPGGKRG